MFNYVDPVWFDVTRLVSKSWSHVQSKQDCSNELVIRMGGKRSRDYVIRDWRSDLYIRTDKRARIHGWKLSCIKTTGANTFTRSLSHLGYEQATANKYFTIYDGTIGKCHAGSLIH